MPDQSQQPNGDHGCTSASAAAIEMSEEADLCGPPCSVDPGEKSATLLGDCERAMAAVARCSELKVRYHDKVA